MSTERKLFWAFAWLALALIGLTHALRQVSVFVLVVPARLLEAPAAAVAPHAPQRQSLSFPLSSLWVSGDKTIRGAGAPISGGAAGTPFRIAGRDWTLCGRVTKPAGGDTSIAARRPGRL